MIVQGLDVILFDFFLPYGIWVYTTCGNPLELRDHKKPTYVPSNSDRLDREENDWTHIIGCRNKIHSSPTVICEAQILNNGLLAYRHTAVVHHGFPSFKGIVNDSKIEYR